VRFDAIIRPAEEQIHGDGLERATEVEALPVDGTPRNDG
jgi:hypothetical protein